MSRAAERYCYRARRTRHLVAVSGGVAQEIRDFFPSVADAVSVIPNGVDREAFSRNGEVGARVRSELGVERDEPVALFVGGDWERKGLRYAVDGVAGAPGWHLVVVGEGDSQHYRQYAAEAQVERRVHFVGATPETAPYYASADAFLLPTVYEAAPLVSYEAAAAGLPLLMSRVSGVEDLLVDGRNGWFIERDAEAIAGRLNSLRDDHGLRMAMGEAAQADSERFAWGRVIDAYDELYRRLAAESSP